MNGDGNGPPMRTAGRARRLSATCAAVVVALLLPLVGCGTTGTGSDASGDKAGGLETEPVVLRMLNPSGGQLSQSFVNEVDKQSNGRIRIEVTELWHMDDPSLAVTRFQDLIDAVRAGDAPLGLAGTSAFHDRGILSFDALLAPLLVDRTELQTAVLHSDIAADMLAGLDGTGLTGIGILPGPLSHPWGADRHLLDVSDYQGRYFFGSARPVTERAIEALGGTYGTTPPSEADANKAAVLPALAMIGNPGGATSVTTNVTFGPFAPVVIGNADAMAALSEQDRSILREAARAAIDIQNAADHSTEAQSVGELCRSGEVAFDRASPAQVDALRAKLEPVYQWLREDPATSGFINRIQQLSESTPADPGAGTSIDCPRSATNTAAPAAATPIDGTYSVTTTLDDLKASGAPPIDLVPEHWGESIYVLDRGRFATTQHNDEACTWAYGRYAIDGDLLTLNFDDGGGLAPNDRAHQPGEHFGVGWSLYRDVLTLSPKEGQPAPMVSGHTWQFQRVNATPDVSALNQQCPPPAGAFPS